MICAVGRQEIEFDFENRHQYMNWSEENLLFYHEIGVALSQWAQVEMTLRDVAVTTVALQDRQIMSIGFYSIENFRSKLQYCDNLLLEKFDNSELIKDWPKLQIRLTKAAEKRNKIAHRTVVTYVNGVPGRRYALVEWLTEQFTVKSKKQKFQTNNKPPQGALCLLDIVHIRYEFFSLSTDLANFAACLDGREPLFYQANIQSLKPPTMSEFRKQMKQLIDVAADTTTA